MISRRTLGRLAVSVAMTTMLTLPHMPAQAEALVKLDFDMKLVPGLATSWERVSPNVWRFQLREGVTFHDGSTFDAEAAKFSLERVIALLPYASDLLNIKEIRAVSGTELEIETNEPFTALPNQLTDAITVIYGKASFDENGEFVKPVGTGPWVFKDYQKQDRTTVVRNDAYWGEAPKLEEIVYRYIPDHNARALALETGEVDFVVHLLPSDVERMKADENFEVYAEPSAGLYYGAFNAGENSVLHDPKVRQAVNLLVDREILVKGALDGIGKPAWTFFPPEFPWAAPELSAYSFNPEKAAELLTEAGYEKDGTTWQKDGEPLSLRILSYSSRAEMAPISETKVAVPFQGGPQLPELGQSGIRRPGRQGPDTGRRPGSAGNLCQGTGNPADGCTDHPAGSQDLRGRVQDRRQRLQGPPVRLLLQFQGSQQTVTAQAQPGRLRRPGSFEWRAQWRPASFCSRSRGQATTCPTSAIMCPIST